MFKITIALKVFQRKSAPDENGHQREPKCETEIITSLTRTSAQGPQGAQSENFEPDPDPARKPTASKIVFECLSDAGNVPGGCKISSSLSLESPTCSRSNVKRMQSLKDLRIDRVSDDLEDGAKMRSSTSMDLLDLTVPTPSQVGGSLELDSGCETKVPTPLAKSVSPRAQRVKSGLLNIPSLKVDEVPRPQHASDDSFQDHKMPSFSIEPRWFKKDQIKKMQSMKELRIGHLSDGQLRESDAKMKPSASIDLLDLSLPLDRHDVPSSENPVLEFIPLATQLSPPPEFESHTSSVEPIQSVIESSTPAPEFFSEEKLPISPAPISSDHKIATDLDVISSSILREPSKMGKLDEASQRPEILEFNSGGRVGGIESTTSFDLLDLSSPITAQQDLSVNFDSTRKSDYDDMVKSSKIHPRKTELPPASSDSTLLERSETPDHLMVPLRFSSAPGSCKISSSLSLETPTQRKSSDGRTILSRSSRIDHPASIRKPDGKARPSALMDLLDLSVPISSQSLDDSQPGPQIKERAGSSIPRSIPREAKSTLNLTDGQTRPKNQTLSEFVLEQHLRSRDPRCKISSNLSLESPPFKSDALRKAKSMRDLRSQLDYPANVRTDKSSQSTDPFHKLSEPTLSYHSSQKFRTPSKSKKSETGGRSGEIITSSKIERKKNLNGKGRESTTWHYSMETNCVHASHSSLFRSSVKHQKSLMPMSCTLYESSV
ncbi:uncharacterized protein LOC141858406 isoform X2 [Brevipalpus obovatus]